jgi:predicted nucleic acid-binding protein
LILIDTSVWIDHFRKSDAELSRLLEAGRVLGHPLVTAELALGSLVQRDLIIASLQGLQQANLLDDDALLAFVADHSLPGTGVGYVDAHLLASVSRHQHARLWTRDRRLRQHAVRLDLSAELV